MCRSCSFNIVSVRTRKQWHPRNGLARTFQYNNLDQMTVEEWRNGGPSANITRQTTFSYDAAGQLRQAQDPDANITMTYDNLGRLTGETDAYTSGPTFRTSTTYDINSRVTQVQQFIGASQTADHTDANLYDNLDRVTRLTRSGAGVATQRVDLAYNARGQYTTEKRYNNSAGTGTPLLSTFNYDSLGRLSTLAHTSGATTLAGYTYTYDALDRITQEVSSVDGTTNYTYDGRSQLTGVTYSNGTPSESYQWDANGNLASSNAGATTVLSNNRLVDDGTYTYSYDAEGRRISSTKKSDGTTTQYTYDQRGRLVGAGTAANPYSQVQEKYDPLDRQIGSIPGAGSSQWYGYTGNEITLNTNSTGTVNSRFLQGPGVDEVFAQDKVGSGTRWTLTDIRGSVRDVANTSNASVGHRIYDGFGKNTTNTGSATDTLFSYTGRYNDGATGLQNNRARWYDASAKRWTSEDPIGFAGGDANVNRYVGNGAVNGTDPSGLSDDKNKPPKTPAPPGKKWEWNPTPTMDNGNGSWGLVSTLPKPPKQNKEKHKTY